MNPQMVVTFLRAARTPEPVLELVKGIIDAIQRGDFATVENGNASTWVMQGNLADGEWSLSLMVDSREVNGALQRFKKTASPEPLPLSNPGTGRKAQGFGDRVPIGGAQNGEETERN